MSSETKINNEFSRLLGDFLIPSIITKAGILELRLGTSPPVCISDSFSWPMMPGITGLEYDSRNIKQGNLYFALQGVHTDGHDYVQDAISRGALAVLHEKELGEYRNGIIYIRVKDSRFAMSPIAAAFYNFPSSCMGIIGVTGTEGKSTTVYLIYQLLELSGKKVGFISTVQHGDGLTVNWTSEHQTTPEAVTIHRLLAEMYQNGVETAVIESSSHGLSKKTNRLGDVDFDVGVITSLTHDHLEFHGTWEQYRSDKAELFRSLDVPDVKHKTKGNFSVPAFGVVNADDPNSEYFAAATKQKIYSFSTKGAKADLSIKKIQSTATGNSYEVFVASSGKTISFEDKLPGAFNAGNVLAALLVVSNMLFKDIEDLIPLVPFLKPVRGRMTAVNRGQPFEVVVDFAHTPSSFQAVLPPLREQLNSRGGRLICLFGSAVERDIQKRKSQGEIAARYSDIVILADEDPRSEDPMTILEDIAKGCEADQGFETASGCEANQGFETASGCEADQGCKNISEALHMIREETLFLIPDRPTAIRKACSLARPGDLVLLLGKGHENSIIYAHEVKPYDEITEAETALEEAGYCAP